MASEGGRQARRETSRINRARMRTERRLQENLQEEIYRSESSRVLNAAGRGSLHTVSFSDRVRDRWRAIVDWLTRQHKYYDVITSYQKELEDEAQVASLNRAAPRRLRRLSERGWGEREDADALNEASRREDGRKITHADRLRGKIGELQALEDQVAQEEVSENTTSAAYEALLDKQEEEDEPLYRAWYNYLGRPAYFEQVASEVRDEAEHAARQEDGDGQVETKSTMDRAVSGIERLTKSLKRLTDFFAQNAVIVSISVEAGFTLPAFLVLTPDKPYAAVLGALVFTAALAGSGSAAALFWRRAVIHSAPTETLPPQRRLSTFFTIAACCALITGGILVTGGADLRSKVPAMSEWLLEDGRIQADQKDLNERLFDAEDAQTRSELADEQLKLAGRMVAQRRSREIMTTFGLPTLHSDKVVAIGVYAFLLVLGALKVILSVDPYFEYHLLAQSIRSVRESRLRLSAAKDLYLNSRKVLRATLARDISSARARLWLLAPDDPLALSPKAENGDRPTLHGADAPAVTDPASAEGVTNDNDHPGSGAWMKERLRRFVRTYLALPGSKLHKNYANSIKEAMQ